MLILCKFKAWWADFSYCNCYFFYSICQKGVSI